MLATLRDNLSYFFMGYIDFEDRCSRRRYLILIACYLLAFIAIVFLSVMFPQPWQAIIFWLFILATLVPAVSLAVKRLHDFNISGYAAIVLLPLFLIGGIWVIFLSLLALGAVPPTPGVNKYGDNPIGINTSVFD